MAGDFVACPEWTEYKKKSGLDPLGMQNSSINLYQRLLPGISNVTLRVRYYGFYAWLAAIYARRSGDTDPRTWQKFVRRAEAVYALAAQRRGDEGGMAGVQWAQRKLDADQESLVEFARHADPGADGPPYLQQPWGAYGAAYASQLFEIGIYAVAKDPQIPVPSPEFGEALASAFEDAAGPLADRLFETWNAAPSRGRISMILRSSPHPPSIERGRTRSLRRPVVCERDARAARRPVPQSDAASAASRRGASGRVPTVAEARWLLYAGADQKNHPIEIDDAGPGGAKAALVGLSGK